MTESNLSFSQQANLIGGFYKYFNTFMLPMDVYIGKLKVNMFFFVANRIIKHW